MGLIGQVTNKEIPREKFQKENCYNKISRKYEING